MSNLTDTKERWKILSRELDQKQELVHRMRKEIDDKSSSLKSTGEEIVDLRKHIKILKKSNMAPLDFNEMLNLVVT